MAQKINKPDLARLEAVLDAHGANPARWPAIEAAGLMAFAKTDPRGVKMLARARALDQVLAVAPGSPVGGVEQLASRIMAKAAATPPGSGEIVSLPQRSGDVSGLPGRRLLHLWQVCGAMAAALLIGFFVGGSDLVVPAFQQVAGLSQDDVETATPVVQVTADEPQEGELL
jgi:hypothetical protein